MGEFDSEDDTVPAEQIADDLQTQSLALDDTAVVVVSAALSGTITNVKVRATTLSEWPPPPPTPGPRRRHKKFYDAITGSKLKLI